MIIKIDRIKKWFDNFRLCLCLVMIAGIFLFFGGARAYADEPVIKSSDFKVSAGVMDALSMDGQNYFMTDIIASNPTGKPMFKIFPDRVWYRYIKTPHYQFNQARFNYPFGVSNTFAGAGWIDDHDTGLGVRCSPNHFGVKPLDYIDFTALILEGQKYQFDCDFNYEFQPGYGLEGHSIYKMDKDMARLLGDWELSAWHNLYPSGKVKAYASWVNNGDEELWIFGMKVATD